MREGKSRGGVGTGKRWGMERKESKMISIRGIDFMREGVDEE